MKAALWVAAYIFTGFLTYGYSYHHNGALYRGDRIVQAAFSGAFWPVYWSSYPVNWAGDAAIEVTK